MSYLHSHNIIHRDLKPANILIDSFLLLKIADFGLSKVKHTNFESMTNSSIVGTVKGTPIYMAPEIWRHSEYSKSTDVYAFSIILYEIITNRKPFENFNIFQIPLKIVKGYRPEFTKPISKAYKKLIVSCWSNESSSRPTFDEIINQLKSDKEFLTESINKEEFFKYVNYIDNYKTTFDQAKIVNFSFRKLKINEELNEFIYNDYFTSNIKIYPYSQFIKLEDECKKQVIKTENDVELRFQMGRYLIEGQKFYPQNTSLGIKYLKKSMSKGSIESVIYYCEMLIKGEVIPRNIKKVYKLLNSKIIEHDKGIYYLLLGKINKKERKYEDAKRCFENSIEYGNNESLYEYGRMLFKGKGFDSNNNINEGLNYFLKAISNGCVKAMYKYGKILIESDKMIKNKDEGIKCIKMAVDNGYPDALYYYSQLLYNDKDHHEEFLQYLKEAAYKGHTNAMMKYGLYLFLNKRDDPFRKKESLIFLKKANDKGQIKELYLYSEIVNEGDGVQRDPKQAIRYLKIAADHGNIEAMNLYGVLLYNGDGVEVDKKEALRYLKMASDGGQLEAMFQYGYILSKGEDVPINKEEAIKYFKMAINKGHPKAMNQYAIMNFIGDGIPVNKEEAIKYYKMTIDKGDTDAMANYASMLKDGDGVQINIEEAIKYYKMAIEEGNSSAMNDYACMLAKGDGVQVDIEESIKYFKWLLIKVIQTQCLIMLICWQMEMEFQ